MLRRSFVPSDPICIIESVIPMFRSIRKGLTSFFATLLLGLLIASFAVWGIGDIFAGGATQAVATVGDSRITAQAFLAEYQRLLQRQAQQTGEAPDPLDAERAGLPQFVLNQMIGRTVFDELARRMGLRVNEDTLQRELSRLEAFYGLDGRFSAAVFETAANRLGYTTRELLDLIAEDVRRAQLLSGLSGPAPVPDALARALFRYQGESRDARIVTVPASAVTLDQAPDQATLRGYFEDNRNAYRRPPYRAVTALFLDPARIGAEIDVNEEDLEAAYEARLADYVKPERRQLSLLSFDSAAEDTAQRARDRIAAGDSLEEVAETFTDFTPEELPLGDYDKATLTQSYSERVAEAVFALEEGAVSAPLQTAFGWQLFRVDAVIPAESRPLEQVREEVRRELAADRAADRVYDLSRDVEDALLSGESLEQIAERLDLPLAQADAVSRSGLGKDGRLVRTEPSLLPVLATAFQMDPLAEPQLTDYADGGYAFVRVDRVDEAVVPPFEEVADRVREDYLTQERRRLAGLQAEEALERMRAGEDPEAVAQAYGGRLLTLPPISRQEAAEGNVMSPAVADLLFSLEPGEIDIAAATDGDGYVLVQPTAARPGDPDQAAEAFAALQARLQAEMSNEMLQLISQQATDALGTEIRQGVVDSVLERVRGR